MAHPVKKLFTALLFLLLPAFASAQNQAMSLGELASLLTIAAENNQELKASFASWKAAMSKAPQVSTMPDPQLKFGYYIEPIETRTGPQRMRYGISQKLPWMGKLASKEQVALRQADVLKSKTDAVKLRIFRDVKGAYYELAYLEQAVTISKESIALMEYMESVVRARYSAGSAPYANVLRTQVALDKLNDQLASLQDSRRPVEARLNAAMSRPGDTPIPAPGTIPMMELGLTDAELKEILKTTNPGLIAYEHQEEAAKAGVAVAEKNYFPDFTVGLESVYTDEPRGNGNVINAGDDPIIASVGINLPIWRESRDAAVEENNQKRIAARKGRLGLKDRLTTDLELALYKYRDAGRRIALYRDTLIPKAEQVIEVTLEAFQNGAASSLDLIDAEKTYFELQLASVRALVDQAQLVANMEYIVGREIPCRYHGYVLKKVAVPEQDLKTTIN